MQRGMSYNQGIQNNTPADMNVAVLHWEVRANPQGEGAVGAGLESSPREGRKASKQENSICRNTETRTCVSFGGTWRSQDSWILSCSQEK